MKRTKRRFLEEIAKEVLAEPYVPGRFKQKSYLEDWIDPARRGGMLRGMAESWFVGSLSGHTQDDLETYFNQFLSDAHSLGKEAAAKRLYLQLMPPRLSNGGPALED